MVSNETTASRKDVLLLKTAAKAKLQGVMDAVHNIIRAMLHDKDHVARGIKNLCVSDFANSIECIPEVINILNDRLAVHADKASKEADDMESKRNEVLNAGIFSDAQICNDEKRINELNFQEIDAQKLYYEYMYRYTLQSQNQNHLVNPASIDRSIHVVFFKCHVVRGRG